MAVGESVLPRSGGLAQQEWERVAPALSSVLLHGLLLIALVLAPAIEARPPQPEETTVDVMSPGQFDEMLRGAKSADRSAEKPVEKAPARAPAESSDLAASASPALNPAPGGEMRIWRKAAQILSDATLADPRHRKLAARLRMLETNTRLEQLCNLEALLQIAEKEARFHPETVIAYAMRETRSDGDSIIADGAAFHSEGQWYNLAYKCRISARQQKVSAFEFATGEAIPEREWAAHDLPRGVMQAADD
jgi:hypothetical protein